MNWWPKLMKIENGFKTGRGDPVGSPPCRGYHRSVATAGGPPAARRPPLGGPAAKGWPVATQWPPFISIAQTHAGLREEEQNRASVLFFFFFFLNNKFFFVFFSRPCFSLSHTPSALFLNAFTILFF